MFPSLIVWLIVWLWYYFSVYTAFSEVLTEALNSYGSHILLVILRSQVIFVIITRWQMLFSQNNEMIKHRKWLHRIHKGGTSHSHTLLCVGLRVSKQTKFLWNLVLPWLIVIRILTCVSRSKCFRDEADKTIILHTMINSEQMCCCPV